MFQESYSVWEKVKPGREADALAEAVGTLQLGVPGSIRATLVTRHGVGHVLFVPCGPLHPDHVLSAAAPEGTLR